MNSMVQPDLQPDLQSKVQQASVDVRENRFDEAMTRLQEVLSESPDHFAANHLLGVAFCKVGRFPEAIARLWKATLLQPDHAGAHTHLGMAYAAAGKVEKARNAFEAALRINPDYILAQTSLGKLPPPVVPLKKVVAASASVPTSSVPTSSDLSATVPPAFPVAPSTSAKSAVAKSAVTKSKVKDFTTPDGVKAIGKAKTSKPTPGLLSGVDWADFTLLGLGAGFFALGLWLRFGAYVDGVRPYKTFGIIAIIIGISMLKAGMPGREHWRDDM